MSLNELADYIETKLCRESVFEASRSVKEESTHIRFPDIIRGAHTMYNVRYSTVYVAFIERNQLSGVDYIRICDFEPTFYDDGLLKSYSYEYHCVDDAKNINLQEIDKMLEHDIALADALLKCHEIDAQIKMLQEIEKL